MTNEDVKDAQRALRTVRYEVSWEGDPKQPTRKKISNGYWVPWHVADLLLGGLMDDNNVHNAELLPCPSMFGIDSNENTDKWAPSATDKICSEF